MEASKLISSFDNRVDLALLVFGTWNVVQADMAQTLVARGDIKIIEKRFKQLNEHLQYAKLTPNGLLKWGELNQSKHLLFSGNGTGSLGNPLFKKSETRFIFSIEMVQKFIEAGCGDELLSFTHEPYRIFNGLGGDV